MFTLNEQKLREVFAEQDGPIVPFDPMEVSADELHSVVDECLERGIIEKGDSLASIAVYPLSMVEPEPVLSVTPGRGPLLLGGSVDFATEDGKLADRSAEVLRKLVEAANDLYRESVPSLFRVEVPERDDAYLFTDYCDAEAFADAWNSGETLGISIGVEDAYPITPGEEAAETIRQERADSLEGRDWPNLADAAVIAAAEALRQGVALEEIASRLAAEPEALNTIQHWQEIDRDRNVVA